MVRSRILQAKLQTRNRDGVAALLGNQRNRLIAGRVSARQESSRSASETPGSGRLLPDQLTPATHQLPPIHRLADEDLIKGQFSGQMDYPDRVFFDFDDDRLNDFQQRRIDLYFDQNADIQAPITLTGLASEEGNRSYNMDLATRRANALRKYILSRKPKVPVTLKPPRVESGKIDYRFVRAVVINEKPDGGGKAATCNIQSLTQLQKKSLELLAQAEANVENTNYEPEIRSLFGDPLPTDAIKANLGRLSKKLGVILNDGAYECAKPDDPVCSSGALAYANTKTNKISYCPENPSGPAKDEKENVNTMIHETLHITPDVFTKDYAYASDPLISHLRQAEALHNTDSYVILIRKLANSIAPPQAGFEGTTTGFNDNERDQIRESIGWATSAVKAAQYQVAILYQAVHLTLADGKWPDSHSGYIDLYKRLAPLFGLAPMGGGDPAKQLSEEVKWKLAGIHDKFKSLTVRVNLDIKKYDINRDDAVTHIGFDFRPIYAIANVQGKFPTMPLDERVKRILFEIVVNEGKLTENYVSAVVVIREFTGNKWPT